MSLTREHIQEDLSVAYISAVVAKAGYDCGNPVRHDYGVDLEINPIEVDDDGGRCTRGMPLRVQAKASHNFSPSQDEFITFALKKKNYNKLVKDTGIGPPYILILYCMPSEDEEWLNVSDHFTTLKHCGYWISLRGRERTNNQETINIKIPKEHLFNESSLIQIMNNIQIPGARL